MNTSNYLAQDAPLSPPDTSRAEEHFERSFCLWIEDTSDEEYAGLRGDFIDKYANLFTKYLEEVYRPLYDKLHKEIEDDRYLE